MAVMIDNDSSTARSGRGTPWIDLVVYGVASGLLITVLRLMEYRFLIVDHAVEIYVALIAVLFAGVGVWLGTTLRREASSSVSRAPATEFQIDEQRLDEFGITPRELEILEQIAHGLSNREIGERLFISESTVKTHSSRLFGKLGAKRRTQAVRLARNASLIP